MNWRLGLLVGIVAVVVGLSGCARGGEGQESPVPEAVLEIVWQMAGPVNDSFYYYVAFDTDLDEGADFPVPVAAGPYWGNGWGTGSITHFLEYHGGSYWLYRADLNIVVRELSGGFEDVTGDVTGGDAGVYTVTVTGVTLGSASVTGTGAIASVTNDSDQNAGTIGLETNTDGTVVANSVVFTPAADGGRSLTGAEQAAFDALNAGGVLLEEDSLDALGLTLTLNAGPDLSGSQNLVIEPAIADVDVQFESASTGLPTTSSGTVTANSSTPTATPPIAGVNFVTSDLTIGDEAVVALEVAATATLIGPPYEYVVPDGTNTLRATVDLSNLGQNLTNISINFITTTELIFDPNVTNPDEHTYDGLGPWGNDAIQTFDPSEYLSISNDTAPIREGSGDSTLEGPATQQERDSVDIIDWEITPHRLL